MPLTTPEQERAIDAQAAVYGTDQTICRGLDRYVVHPASEWDADDAKPFPADAVAVHFIYLPPREDTPWFDEDERGLEVTVFAADGTVLDSQDFG